MERNQRYRVIEEFDAKNENPMIRAYVANGCREIRQINSGYNNVFLGGSGEIILGDEIIEDVKGARIYLPRDIWKTGIRDKIDDFIKKNPTTEDKPGVLGLECFDEA